MCFMVQMEAIFNKSAAALNGSSELENNLHSSNRSHDLEIISETCTHADEMIFPLMTTVAYFDANK